MERQVKTKLDEMEVQLRNDIQVELQSEFDRQMNTAKEEIITKMKQDFNSEKKLMKTELESKIDTKIQTEKPEVLFYAFRNTGTINQVKSFFSLMDFVQVERLVPEASHLIVHLSILEAA